MAHAFLERLLFCLPQDAQGLQKAPHTTVCSSSSLLCSSPIRRLQRWLCLPHSPTIHFSCWSPPLPVTSNCSDDFCMTVSYVMQPHPASAAAAAVLVAHASSLGPDADANTKYNADGSSFTGGPNEMEQGMGQGPLGQSRDVINVAPLVRQQTHGPVSYHIRECCVHVHGMLWCACVCLRACMCCTGVHGLQSQQCSGFSLPLHVVEQQHSLACTYQNHAQHKCCYCDSIEKHMEQLQHSMLRGFLV